MSTKRMMYTVNINDYAPSIGALTIPLMKKYANKIGAELFIITERKFPDYPIPYEKMQISTLAREHKADWVYMWDWDVLIHPDNFSIDSQLPMDTTCAGQGSDFSPHRFRPDKYFLRDHRNIGKGGWMCVASSWTVEDYYHPLDDITKEEAIANITPYARGIGFWYYC